MANKISAEEADGFKKSTVKINHVVFLRADIEAVLAVPGAAGIRVYNGAPPHMVAVDKANKDITAGKMLFRGIRECPPHCEE